MPETADSPADNRLKVFISYARTDFEIAEAMTSALEAARFEVLIDRRDLPYGEEWQKELGDFIRSADTVVWLVSPASVNSKWVAWELGEVGRLAKRLVPVRVAAVSVAELPEAIGRIHMLPAEEIYDQRHHLECLIDALNTDRVWLKEATRFADRAHQWLTKDRASDLLLRGRALADAETWSRQHPKTAPLPASEVLELIMTSHRAAARRRRWWTGAGVSTVAVLAQVALLSLFFRNDAAMNEARYSLQNGQVEKAQQQLETLLTSPFNRILPASASTRALATQFFDTALTQPLVAFPVSSAGAAIFGGEIIAAGDRLYAAALTSQSRIIVRCDQNGHACEYAPLGPDWKSAEFVRDGVDVFLVSHDSETMEGYRIASVPRIGALTLSPVSLATAKLNQIRNIGETRIWKGRDFTRDLSSRGDMFRESPAMTSNADFAAVGELVKLEVPGDNENEDQSRSLIYPAACSERGLVCVTGEVNTEADARGTIKRFDVWVRAKTVALPSVRTAASSVPKPRGAAPASAPARPRTAPKPTAKLRYVRKIEGLFQPLPSENRIGISHDGSWIAISENKKLHLWLTGAISDGDRRPFRTIQLVEEVLAIHFDKPTGDLFVLGPRSLKRVIIAPRSIVVTPGSDVMPRNLEPAGEIDDPDTYEIDRFPDGTGIFRDKSGKIIARNADRPDRTLHVPSPRSTPEVQLWKDQRIVTILYERENETFIVQPAAPDPQPSLLVGRLSGAVVEIDRAGRIAVLARPGCVLRIHTTNELYADIRPFGVKAACAFNRENVKVVDSPSAGFLLAVFDRRGDESERESPYRIFAVSTLPKRVEVRQLAEGTASPSNGADWAEEEFALYDSGAGSFVVSGDESAPIFRIGLVDGQMLDLMRRSRERGALFLRRLSATAYLMFLDTSDCGLSTGEDDREITGTFALMWRDRDHLVPQFLLRCVARFPDRPNGHNADMAHVELGGRHFIGAYTFPGLFEWNAANAVLKLYQLPEVATDEPAAVKEFSFVFEKGEPGTTLRTADLRGIEHASFWTGATEIEASKDGRRLAFFKVAHGSAGHSSAANVVDLSAMNVRRTPNETANFFDNISAVWLSPNAELVLTYNQESNRYELFRFGDLQRIPLPEGVAEAEFKSDEELELTLSNGAHLRWLVPEGTNREIEFLERRIGTKP